MAKFKPGDKVWVNVLFKTVCGVPAGKYAGVIIETLTGRAGIWMRSIVECECYVADIEELPDSEYYVAEFQLEPRHEGYDGDKAGSWETSPYKPEREKELV